MRRRSSFVLGLVVAAMLWPAGARAQNTEPTVAPAPLVPHRSYQRPATDPSRAADFTLPDGAVIPLPQNPGRYFRFAPRYGRLNNQSGEKLPDGVQRIIYTGGVIVYVSPGASEPEIEFATDNAVVWIRGGQKVDNPGAGFEASTESKREVEVYLSGNVVIRTVSPGAGGNSFMQTLRAKEVYYDVAHNRAIALAADLELSSPRIPDGIHLTGREIRRLDKDNWEVLSGSSFSTKLPADPGLRFDSSRVLLHEETKPLTNIFGIPYRDFEGKDVIGTERIMTARNSVGRLNGVPFFYWPYVRTDLNEPIGPLLGLGGGQDRIFGTQIYTTWDMYKILALRPPEGHKWTLSLDFLSDRGPAAGTDYYYSIPKREDGYAPGSGLVRLYGISDGGVDQLGGDRGPQPTHPNARGRALWRHQQEVFEGAYFQGQVGYLSDQNFFEQYYKQEFDFLPSQETFAYLTWQRDNLWAGGLALPRLGQNWMTRTEWLPKVDGALIGQSFFDLLSYNSRASAGYAQLSTSNVIPYPVLPTDVSTNTARVNWNQELSVPFDLGPVRAVPYGVLDLTYYSNNLNGDDSGRVYGGGGIRTNLPLSRLYESVSSELFNLHGLHHKMTFSANYFYGETNVSSSTLPLLDRLDDDNTDYTYRYIRPAQTTIVPGAAGFALATSPIFNQQQYAIRRLVDNRVDSLDDMQVLQGGMRHRFQTKRGFPGLEHTVDWLTFDVTASYFPQANRDNYGKPFAFLEYGALWNVGDRTSVLSSGWFDPFDFGANYWNIGVSLDRPDRTNVYVGYRQTDPLNSKAVTAALSYQLSNRYFASVGVSYDFGIQTALSNTVSIARTGSDMTVSLGFTYNALVNNFGVNFMIVPNILSAFVPNFGAPGSFGARR
jgi:hypothetical protein